MTMTTKVSETGSVQIPKAIRDAQGLSAGTELEVIERDGEIVLRGRMAATLAKAEAEARRKALYPPITVEEFLERLPKYDGPPVTLEMMDEAVMNEARRRWHEKGG